MKLIPEKNEHKGNHMEAKQKTAAVENAGKGATTTPLTRTRPGRPTQSKHTSCVGIT
ncbi:hypothetical protein PSDVSF_29110 [Pseudodesulfovibrio sediminis]|uniref:Uncharacterized protein n=1 Tax=Pseudodesulfovibrio sediminis TaxID=2810563 RepID=A0ABN6EWW3_9BACT|nr:hypothetical protein PSDVSF_29110 [Pseudodesulfovibrio sediminis]